MLMPVFASPPARVLACLLLVSLAGCGTWSNPVARITPYKIDIQQGNRLTQDMLDRLKPGMTPAQVRFILGTPLVVDPFRDNRWDYVYIDQRRGRTLEQRRISVMFEDGVLKGVEGDVVAAGMKPEARP